MLFAIEEYISVDSHAIAFLSCRTRTGSSSMSLSTEVMDRVNSYFIASAYDKSDSMYANSVR